MVCQNPGCARTEAPYCCGTCGTVAYCSRICQRAHWGSHKSRMVVNGCRFCAVAAAELLRMPPDAKNRGLTDHQLVIRKHAAKSLARSQRDSFPAATRPIYEQYPVWAFYQDKRGRPVRVFGAIGYEGDNEPRLHTITLRSGGNSFFTAGGVVGGALTAVLRWSPDCLRLIDKSKSPGLFLDPLGHEVATGLAESTGYDILSDNLCSCCLENGTLLSVHRPVLFSAEHVQAMTTACDSCGKLRRGRLCGRCQKARYCSTECQANAWPVHKHTCRRV